MDRFTRFSPDALRFLRALKRHNNREWFNARKNDYERLLRAPMIGLIERLASDLPAFAPDLVASPRHSLYRIHRDTRFSADKRPYKTWVAASFPHRELPKHQGAGLYLHVSVDDGVWIGGGMYAPTTSQLQAVREHIADNTRRWRALVESPAFRGTVGELEGEKLQRVPRGFAKDHEAAEYLRYRQFLAGCQLPSNTATSTRFYPQVLRIFRCVAPLTAFLNESLLRRS